MSFIYYTSIFLFLLLCVILCFSILIQESKSMGLGASFGGDPGESLFGTSTADVLKKFTAYLAFIFIGACIILSFWSASVAKKPASVEVKIEKSE